MSVYPFEVWEPAYSIVNWTVVVMAGLFGGLLGYLLSELGK